MRRLHIIVLAVLALSAALLGASIAAHTLREDRTLPEIRCPDDPLTVSVQEGSDSLLQGVTAWDEKDGDLTGSLLVQRVERDADSGEIYVTYAVADSDHHVVTKERTLRYSDYTPPRFTLSRALRYTPGSSILLRDRLSASDFIDGDASDRTRSKAGNLSNSYAEGVFPIEAEVVNSLGDTAKLTLDVEVRSFAAGEPVISLWTYLVYLKEGEAFPAADYIESVTDGDAASVAALLPEGGLQKGVNKVQYVCTGYSGVPGSTTLYVIVE